MITDEKFTAALNKNNSEVSATLISKHLASERLQQTEPLASKSEISSYRIVNDVRGNPVVSGTMHLKRTINKSYFQPLQFVELK